MTFRVGPTCSVLIVKYIARLLSWFSTSMYSHRTHDYIWFSTCITILYCIVCKDIQHNFTTKGLAGIFPSQHFMQWSIASTFLLHCWWPSHKHFQIMLGKRHADMLISVVVILSWQKHSQQHATVGSCLDLVSLANIHVTSLVLGDANRHQSTGSSLVKLMDCRLFGAKLLLELPW